MTSTPGPQDDPLTTQHPHDPVVDPNVEEDPPRDDVERGLNDEVDLETNPVHEEGPDGNQSQRR